MSKRREQRTIWFKRIEDCRESGLSQAEYCRQHDLKPSNFYNWSIKYRDQQKNQTFSGHRDEPGADFIPVTVQTVADEFTLRCGDVSLTFSSHTSPDRLLPWIKALRAGAC